MWWKDFSSIAPVAKYEHMLLHKEAIIKGFEDSERKEIWLQVSEASSLDKEAYTTMLDVDSPFEKMIKKDIKRTFPATLTEQDQEKLFRMLKVFSVFDGNIGYCQGMSFIAGILIKNLSEEESFAVFIQLMHNFQIGSFYQPGMNGLNTMLYQFDCLLEDFLPNIHSYFVKLNIESSLYASQWFLTMYSYRFPYNTVVRIFDLFLLLGTDAIFRIALSILRKNEYALLSKPFDELVDYLKHGLLDTYTDVDDLIKDALDIPPLFVQLSMYQQDHFRMQHSPKSSPATPLTPSKSMFSKLKDMYSSQDELEDNSYLTLRKEYIALHSSYKDLQDTNTITLHSYEDLKAEHEILIACLQELFQLNNEHEVDLVETPELKSLEDPKDETIQQLEKELMLSRHVIVNQNEHLKDLKRVVDKIERLLREAF